MEPPVRVVHVCSPERFGRGTGADGALGAFLLGDCYSNNTCPEQMTGCPGQINVAVTPAPRADLTMRLLAFARSGYRRLYDYGVDVYMDETDIRVIRSSTTVTIPAGSMVFHPAQSANPICWRNDHIDSGDSEIEFVIVNGAGYRVDTAQNSLVINVTENDDCSNPGNRTVYVPVGGNLNNMCVCQTREVAVKLYPGSVRGITNDADDLYVMINGNRSLLSGKDSSNYCLESPYQGPGS